MVKGLGLDWTVVTMLMIAMQSVSTVGTYESDSPACSTFHAPFHDVNSLG